MESHWRNEGPDQFQEGGGWGLSAPSVGLLRPRAARFSVVQVERCVSVCRGGEKGVRVEEAGVRPLHVEAVSGLSRVARSCGSLSGVTCGGGSGGLSRVTCGGGGRVAVARVRWLRSHCGRRGSQHQLLA